MNTPLKNSKLLLSSLLILGLSASSLNAAEPPTSARDIDAIRRLFSSNIRLADKFQKRFHDLADKESTIPLTAAEKKELTNLKMKIEVLVDENEHYEKVLSQMNSVVGNASQTEIPKHTPKRVYLSGGDWSRMTVPHREYFVFRRLGALEERGAYFNKSSYEYLKLLDDKLKNDSSLESQSLDHTFLLVIHEAEPVNRRIIDEIIKTTSFN